MFTALRAMVNPLAAHSPALSLPLASPDTLALMFMPLLNAANATDNPLAVNSSALTLAFTLPDILASMFVTSSACPLASNVMPSRV